MCNIFGGNKHYKTAIVCVTVLLSCFCLIGSASSLTYQSSVGVNFTFNPTINLSVGGNLLINNLTPGNSSDSNIIDVAVSTNASYGYVLSATVGQKNGTDSLVNTSNSTYTFTNLSTTAGSAATLSNFADNKWGYSYSVDSGTNWISGSVGSTASGYAGLPLDNNDNAEDRGLGGVTLIDTDNPADNKTIKFKIGAKAANDQAAGTYSNTINFYAVANPEPTLGPVACTGGKICYNSNSLDPVQGEMGQQSASNNASITLYAPNYKRSNYGFAGWNTEYDYSGTSYGPNQTITTPSNTSTNGLSLYAMWVPSAGSMQNWTGCSGLAQGAVTALTDSRDGDTYAVAKLADGKCWMIENLRLDNTPELSSANTHNPSLPITNVYDTTNPTTSNHLSSTTNPTQTAWCNTNSSACNNQSMLNTDNTTLFTSNEASNYSNNSYIYSYGNYYNWYSATAGHGIYGNNQGSGYTAPGDICPAGWHLPTGKTDTTGEFAQLSSAIKNADPSGSSSDPDGSIMSRLYRAFPNNLVYSGYVTGSSFGLISGNGTYWSASGYYTDHADYVSVYSGNMDPGLNARSKYFGRTVRCVAGT